MKKERNKNISGHIYTTGLTLILFFSTHLHADLAEDMFHLEQRYIPVLLYSAQSDVRAVPASGIFQAQWSRFKAQHAYNHTEDGLWGFDMVRIERAILDGQRLIQAGEFERAHDRLLSVRLSLAAMRHRHQLESYLDGFIHFDSSLQALLDKLQRQYADDVYLEISATQAAWQALLQHQFNLHDYKLSLQKQAYLQECLQQGQQLLDAMEQSFSLAEYDRLPAMAAKMQDVYNNTYAIFAIAN
ncbi:MAG: hypothetical protein OEX03_05400 [Gammaproteobacteria bacterium]|nr:hypothetical protein [Gammaproteobacteria bacterium]